MGKMPPRSEIRLRRPDSTDGSPSHHFGQPSDPGNPLIRDGDANDAAADAPLAIGKPVLIDIPIDDSENLK